MILKAYTNPYIPVDLTVKQLAALAAPFREILFGGQAGGGKSIELLAAGLLFVDVPGYNAILFRRTYSDLALPDAIMDISHQWLSNTDAKWNDKLKRWRFPSGSTLSFGYLDHPNDRYRYQGAQFQFIGFDELTQFERLLYVYMFSRLRRKKSVNVPLRMAGATNPGNIGHEWVYNRFIESPGDNRIFIPAGLADNPHIDAESYIEGLGELDEVERRQLLDGEWISSGDITRFLPVINLWDSNYDPQLPPLGSREPLVIALDAGVTHDNFALVGVSRHPLRTADVALRFAMKWVPEKGKPLDFDGTPDQPGPARVIKWLKKNYNVIMVTYDPYQLHYMATQLEKSHTVWMSAFDQGKDRLQSDKQLYDLIVHKRLAHDGTYGDVRDHLNNANKKFNREDSSYRIIKRTREQPIDLAVALSMATARCLELAL